jgi:hypothetical protein
LSSTRASGPAAPSSHWETCSFLPSASKLILNTPALLGRFLERQAQWQAGITDILAQRTGLDARADLRPALAAGVALTAFNTALRRWADSNGRQTLVQLADRAFALEAPALALTTDAS